MPAKRKKRAPGRPPLTLKQRERRHWERKVAKLRRLLRTIEGKTALEGTAWVMKMREHYGRKLAALLAMEPPKR